jgi:ribonucleoside-diphosphate reductase alpha chain/ribonucleoside-triphosphate reductase
MVLTFISDEKYTHIKHIKISYNSIRPKGERLMTFGGTASGHEPLKEMFANIDKVFRNQIDKALAPLEEFEDIHGQIWYLVRPVHILDIANLVGNNVVVGGRR